MEQWTEAEAEAEAAAERGEDVDPVPAAFYAEEYGLKRLHLLDNIVAHISEDGEEEGRAGQVRVVQRCWSCRCRLAGCVSACVD